MYKFIHGLKHYVTNRVSADIAYYASIFRLYLKREKQDRITLWRSAVRNSVFYDYVLLCVSMCLSVTGRLPNPSTLSLGEQFTFLLISFVGTPSLLNMIKAF